MKKLIESAIDDVTEVLEKFSGPVDRIGHSAHRAWMMGKANVDDSVIAAQLTATSKRLGKNHVYDGKFAEQLRNLYEDSISGTPIPAKSARALIDDQKEAGCALQPV